MSKGLRTTGWLLLLLAIVLLIIFVGRGKRAEKRAALDAENQEEVLTLEEGENENDEAEEEIGDEETVNTDEDEAEEDNEENEDASSTSTAASASSAVSSYEYDGIGGGSDIYTSSTSYTASYSSVYQSSGYTVGVPNSLGSATYRSTFTEYTPYTNTAHVVDNSFLLTENIGVCDCGAEALAVQMCLDNLGYFDHPEYTGCFGRGATTEGLQKFQEDFGINEHNYANDHGDAYVGDVTMAVMNALCFADNAPQKVGIDMNLSVTPMVLGAETSTVVDSTPAVLIVTENDDDVFTNGGGGRRGVRSVASDDNQEEEEEEEEEILLCQDAMITIRRPSSYPESFDSSAPPTFNLSGIAFGNTDNWGDVMISSIQNSSNFSPENGLINIINDFDASTEEGTLYVGVLPTSDDETDSIEGVIEFPSNITIVSVDGINSDQEALLGQGGLEEGFDSVMPSGNGAKFILEWSSWSDFFAIEYTCNQ